MSTGRADPQAGAGSQEPGLRAPRRAGQGAEGEVARAGGAEALSFAGVVKRYRGGTLFRRRPVRGLEGLELRVPTGSCFGLVGMNGAGKTTAIRCLLDLCGLDGGEIAIFGTPHRETRARAPLAFLPEQFLPPWYLTGEQFLRYMCRLHGVEPGPGRVRGALDALELAEEALRRPVRSYSKGMAQKLGLIACLLSEKPLLVLDEPMSGLDPKARALVKAKLKALHEGGATIFFSTHLLVDVEELCDRMAVLHEGRALFAGSPAECRERWGAGTLEEAYLACVAGTDRLSCPAPPATPPRTGSA